MSRSVRLDFCCNNPDNGLFDHRIAGVQLPDLDLELAARDLRGPSFALLDDGRMRISRRQFRYTWSREWIGNWCWNAYYFDPAEAVELLSYLHGLGKFSPECGADRLFDMWTRERPFGPAERETLERRLLMGMWAEEKARAR